MTLFSSLQTLLALGLLFRHEQSMSGQWEPPRDIGNKSIGRDTLSSPRITNSEDHVNWSCYETTLWLQKKCHLQNRFSVSRKPKLSAIDSGLLDPSNLSDMLDNPNWFTSQVRDWRNILWSSLCKDPIVIQAPYLHKHPHYRVTVRIWSNLCKPLSMECQVPWSL